MCYRRQTEIYGLGHISATDDLGEIRVEEITREESPICS